MNILFVILLTILSLVVLFTLLILKLSDTKDTPAWFFPLMAIVPLSLGWWMIVASSQPYEVSRETRVVPIRIPNPDGTYLQTIIYVAQNGDKRIVDCKIIFMGVLPDESAVLVRECKDRYYSGISFGNHHSYRLDVPKK